MSRPGRSKTHHRSPEQRQRGAEATARHRARIGNHQALYGTAAGEAVLDMLVRREYLKPDEVGDQLQVEAAISAYLHDQAIADARKM